FYFFFSSRRRHTRWPRDWSSDVCSSDLSSSLLRRSCRRRPAEVRGPAVWNPRRSKLDEEHGLRRAGRGSQLHACLLQRPVALARSEERRVGKEAWSWGAS